MNNLPHFKTINSQELNEYYVVEIDFNGRKISIDLNFENKIIDQSSIENIKNFLENIDKFDKQNKSHIEENFKEEGETLEYLNFYIEELDQEELSNIINNDNTNTSNQVLLLKKLQLNRIGLYPDGKYNTNYYAVFDYSIDINNQPCDQILVVKTNEKGDLDHIAWES